MKFHLSIFIIIASLTLPISAWTWLHHIKLSNARISSLTDKWHIEKTNIKPFSQLLFSWNGMRKNGYYSFWVQARDSITKRWYNWHQAAFWGKDLKGNKIQKSLQSKSKTGTKYIHVRLELPKNRTADSFRVMVKTHNGAKLQDIQRITVNTVNLHMFNSEVHNLGIANLPSVYIAKVPPYSQMVIKHPRPRVLCSPASTAMLVAFLLKKNLDPHHIVKGVYDYGLKAYGSWPFNVAHAYEACNGKKSFHVERLLSFKELHTHLTKGFPVIVSVRGLIKGAPICYSYGHILVVVGYNKRFKKVLCQDPAFENNAKIAVAYDLRDFLRAWERSYRLAYVTTNL